jgi:hypothetical protein
MTNPPASPYAERRLSKSALTSFICGILGCIPFLTGLLAVLLGIVGIMRTGSAGKRGRWMAVIGLILGIVSILAWSGASVMGGGIWAFVKATEGPRIAAHDFIRDVSAGNDAAAKAEAPGMTDADYDAAATQIRAAGRFVDTTFYATNIVNDDAHATGIAVFDNGSRAQYEVKADLEKVGTAWKVKDLHLGAR